ncbi:MAG: hypothetical protein D6772_13420 [Bacteroidetes bacterium]|nr:MAG: hypothetical protein D6772_13420 [Bacteroidota bacterium]
MYSFAQRPDTTVVDEPLYAYYLATTQERAKHPATEAILASQSSDGATVIREVLQASYPTPVVVFKQMTHHLLDLDRSFFADAYHVLLVRDPRAILASYSKVITKLTAYDIGIPQQQDLYQTLKASGQLHAIVDAKRLLLDPAGVLRSLCKRLGLSFTEAMLSWPAGPRPEDGVWAPYWYQRVHQSTGFASYQAHEFSLRPDLEQIAQACAPAYAEWLADDLLC